MSLKPVVITGAGVVSPLGNSFSELFQGLCTGRTGVRETPELERVGGLRARLGATVDDVDPKVIPRKFRRSMSNMSIYAYLASEQALDMGGFPRSKLASGRIGVCIGSTLGSTATSEKFFLDYFRDHSLERMKSGLFFQLMGHSCAANVAQSLGIAGRMIAPSAACATGCQAIGYAYEQIAFGRQDAMLCGGSDELHPLTVATFDVMSAASTAFNAQPTAAPRPFDANRDGLVCGEGSGILLLESRESAEARGARVLAEVIGFATNSDASSIARPDVGAMVACMRQAVQSANIEVGDIDYVNAHATGTLQGDIAEAKAIATLFRDEVSVSSLKGHLGHCMAASGSIELAGCVGMLLEQKLIATRNLDQVDEQCSGICHVRENVAHPVRTILKNNFAMGGVNSTLIIRSFVHDGTGSY